jgi:hypothetical protein
VDASPALFRSAMPFSPHQVTHTVPSGTTRKQTILRCTVNPRQRYRRLYLGGYFYGGISDALWTCRVRFLGDGSNTGGGEFLFGWKSQISGFIGTVTEFSDPNTLYRPVPPFSVEEVPTGSAGEFVTTVPGSRDEMAIVAYDLDPGAVRLVRMQPIPIFSDCSVIEAEWRFDYNGTPPELVYGFLATMGVRSSEVAL